MTEFYGGDLPVIPDHLTLVQFILDEPHAVRPIRPHGVPWFIEDATGRQIDYEEIRARVHGLANGLTLEYGIREDDVVCIFSPNHVDYPVAVWGIHRLGAAASCANPAYTASELAYQLQASKSTVILVQAAFVDTARAAAKESGLAADRLVIIDGDGHNSFEALVQRGLRLDRAYTERTLAKGEGKRKIAFLSFSSGTTGKPKAVAIPHYAPIANIIQMAGVSAVGTRPEVCRYKPGDVALAVLPFFHIYGLVVVLHFMLFAGNSLVVIPKFNFENFLKSVERYKIQHMLVVPPMVVLLCKHPAAKKADLSHVKLIMSGAAPLSHELTMELAARVPSADIGQGYGMTETATTVAFIPAGVKLAKLGSAGRLVPGIRARVVKPDGTLAKAKETGELVVSGPSMALGYANNAEATKETFVDGWVRTGDEVYIDEDNDLFVVDRLKELIKVRGFQVPPAELEGHILTHPDIADVCVVGVPHEYSGEVPRAYVVLNAAAQARVAKDAGELTSIADAVARWVADHKVAYKRLAGGVAIVDSVPKNPSGKLLRRVLRDQARAEMQKRTAGAKTEL